MRLGTITLFAALEQMRGKLIARTETSHTHVEWLRFRTQINRETPGDPDLRLITDNYATHKHPKVQAWLAKRPRFTMYFTPTSLSSLNLVERLFADLTGDVIRAGSFASANELVRDIKAYLAQRNTDPKPCLWRAEGAEIPAKIKRARGGLGKAAAA
ncbi:MAG: transposase [Acetobacteraceae bacterium]